METDSSKNLLLKIEELENRLQESEQLIEAIKAGEVDAFAINNSEESEIYTLQSGDYAYRILIEEFGDGAVNVTEEGLIVYTNKAFADLLNVPYEKIVGSQLPAFIHPGSMAKFETLFELAIQGKSKGEINLAIDNRIIPVYISLTSLQPKLATVGIIITDFTEKKKNEEVILDYQKNLEIKNLELVQSNAELGSFGYVASHDLQEPLRKIRTFTNLIQESDGHKFSVSTRDYFQRIISSATRMQNLITALLNYSRAGTAETLFETVSLNWILQTVEVNLREIVEEHKAVIKTGPLPVLYIVPDQMVQLFTNIIGNAIKYKKPATAPFITISAELVEPAEMRSVAVVHTRFWKITVADNGIGFEPKYADKIFELFQRLYSEAEYEGTGIGLAICKKIMANHKGFIKATGEPGVGSTFSIYLPATQK